MRKARVHHDCKYAFGGLIFEFCCRTGVPEEDLEYFPRIEAPYNVTNINRLDESKGHVLTTVERNHRDKPIIGYMFGLEMLCHKIGGRPSTQQEINEVEARYPLNAHANAVLGISP